MFTKKLNKLGGTVSNIDIKIANKAEIRALAAKRGSSSPIMNKRAMRKASLYQDLEPVRCSSALDSVKRSTPEITSRNDKRKNITSMPIMDNLANT